MGGDKHNLFTTHSPRGGGGNQADPLKRFGCVFCSYRFRHYRQLEEHMVTHTKERPFHCDKCDLSFSAKKSLWEHERVYHLGKKWKCVVCGNEFTTTSGLSLHKKLHGDGDWWRKRTKEFDKEEEEKGISKAFKTAVWKAISNKGEEGKTEMVEEVKEEKDVDLEETAEAPPPKKKLKLLLKREMKRVGKGKRKWKCDICGKIFFRNDDYSLKRHKRNVHKILNPVSTTVPSEIISLEDLLEPEGKISLEVPPGPEVQHRLEDPSGPEPQVINSFEDPTEPEVNNSLDNVDDPTSFKVKIVSVDPPVVVVPEVKISKKEKRLWTCEICKKKFFRPDNYSLKRHLRTVHRELNITVTGYQWSEPLDKAVTSASVPLPLPPHSKVNEQGVIKPGKTKLLISNSRNRLVNLRRRRKAGASCPSKQIGEPCPFCGEMFTRLDSVYRHIERFHSEEPGDDEEEEEDDNDQVEAEESNEPYEEEEVVEQVEEETPSSSSSHLELFSEDAPIELNLHPPCAIPFFNFPPVVVAAGDAPQPKNEWDPSFFLHMNRYDPIKDAESLEPPPPPPPPKPANPYKCDKCGHTMAHKWSLQRHQKRDRCTSPRKMFQSPTLRYVCAFCNYDFNERRGHLVRHLSGVHRFGDDSHQQLAPQSSSSHRRKIHSDFSCVYCDKRTKTKDEMQVHISKTHAHILGIPRDKYSNSADQSLPSTAKLAEEPPQPPEIVEMSDSSLSSSMGSSLIEITDDTPPPPPSCPTPSQSDESIVFIEEHEKDLDLNPPPPPPPPNSMEIDSQALTELVDSQQKTPLTQEIETVLPSSSSSSQEIPPLSLAQLVQLDRELGEHTPQSTGTSMTSASHSTAPSSPASVVSESELETTLDDDVVSPAIPEVQDVNFKSSLTSFSTRRDDTVQPTSSCGGAAVGGSEIVHFSTSSSSSSSEEANQDNELSASPPQQVAFEKEVETIIEALLPLVSRFDFDNQVASSVQVELLELEADGTTGKEQRQQIPIVDKRDTGILEESPAIFEHDHQSPPPVIHKLTEEHFPYSQKHILPSPVDSEHLESPPFMALPVVEQTTPPISQVELPPTSKHVNSTLIILQNIHDPPPHPLEHGASSSSPPNSEHVEPPSHSPPYIVSREEEESTLMVEVPVESPPIIPEHVESSSIHLERMESSPPPSAASQFEYPTILQQVEPPQPLQSSSPQSLTEELEEPTPPTSPSSSSIEMLDKRVQSPQTPPRPIPEEMELGATILERVDVNTPPPISIPMESPQTPAHHVHANAISETRESPPMQHATLSVNTANDESTTSSDTSPIDCPIILEPLDSPPSIPQYVESPPQTPPLPPQALSPPVIPESSVIHLEHVVEPPQTSQSPRIKSGCIDSIIISQSSTPNSPSSSPSIEMIDERVDTPPSAPEHVQSPQTQAPKASPQVLLGSPPENVHAIPSAQTEESPIMQQDTRKVITLNGDSAPSSFTFPVDSSGCDFTISQSSSIEMIDECVHSPQTSPQPIPEQIELGDAIHERVDTPPSLPEHVGSPQAPPPKSPQVFRESPQENVHATSERVLSSIMNYAILPAIALNEESTLPDTSECVQLDSAPRSVSLPHSDDTEPEESTPNSQSTSIEIIDECFESPQDSPPSSSHINPEKEETSPAILEHAETCSLTVITLNAESHPPSSGVPSIIPEQIETSQTPQSPPVPSECVDFASESQCQSLPHSLEEFEESTPNSPSQSVEIIDEYVESPQESPSPPSSPHINPEQVESADVIFERVDSPPPSIPKYVESPPQTPPQTSPQIVHAIPKTVESPPLSSLPYPVGSTTILEHIESRQTQRAQSPPPATSEYPGSQPLPHSSEAELHESPSNSTSPFTQLIVECDQSPPQTSQPSSPHITPDQLDTDPIILELMDSPPSIPQTVESTSMVHATIPTPHVHLPQTPQSSPINSECVDSIIISQSSPSQSIVGKLDKSTPPTSPPSPSIQMIDERVQSPQASPHPIQEMEQDPAILECVDVNSPPSVPEHVESPEHPVTSECADYTPVSPSSPHSDDTQQEESTSNSSSSPFIEIIDECGQSPQTSQPSPQKYPEPTESDPAFLEHVDSPPSIPEYVESSQTPPHPSPHPIPEEKELGSPPSIPENEKSPPQTPPPPPNASSSLVPPESPPEHENTIPETVESPPTLPVIPSNEESTPSSVTPFNLEPLDSPPSIPEYVECPQTPPPQASPPVIPESSVTPEYSQSPPQTPHSSDLVDPTNIESVPTPQTEPPPPPPERVVPVPDNESDTLKDKGKGGGNAVYSVSKARRVRPKSQVKVQKSTASPIVTRTLGYFCHLCPLSFEPTARGKYHLSRHLAGIHRHEERTLKFACVFCALGHSVKDDIQRHILYIHGDLLVLTNKAEEETEEEKEEDSSPPILQRMDEHVQVQDNGEEEDEEDWLPPVLTPIH